jgi:quinol monooxygenase YgiN
VDQDRLTARVAGYFNAQFPPIADRRSPGLDPFGTDNPPVAGPDYGPDAAAVDQPSNGTLTSAPGWSVDARFRRTLMERLEAAAVCELHGIARFKLHEGKIEEFKRLSAQCMEIVRTKDTGTLQYDIYISEDQSECIVHEAYQDSAALKEHLANLGDLTQAILATGSVSGELLGEPSAELRAELAGSPVRLYTPFLSLQTGSNRP